MQLKQYQADALAVLRRFFEEARMAGPRNAYETITKEPEYADRLGRYGGTYSVPLADLPNVPYVCLRLPTGGGKTILGAHAVAVARDAWVEKDYPLGPVAGADEYDPSANSRSPEEHQPSVSAGAG